MRHGELTPRRAYRVIITQVEGERPVVTVDCSRCVYLDNGPELPVDAGSVQLAEVILGAVVQWTRHECEAAYVDSNMTYPQERPAVSSTERTRT